MAITGLHIQILFREEIITPLTTDASCNEGGRTQDLGKDL